MVHLTACSLALKSPRGSRPQIIFFIGLFQRSEVISPALRGRLVVSSLRQAGPLEDTVHLFERIQSHHDHLGPLYVDELQLLLSTSANTS